MTLALYMTSDNNQEHVLCGLDYELENEPKNNAEGWLWGIEETMTGGFDGIGTLTIESALGGASIA